ncbi:MAG: hypothetical protein ABSF29_15055 [Tepidisphaeraceae bacterium]|jgi:hypothetical protein
MKRTTKLLGSTTGLLAAAAFAGLINGSATRAAASTSGYKASAAKITLASSAGVNARHLDGSSGTHACKGQNSCKGQGGCNTGDQGCKGKNSCQGKGGCKTNGSL